MSDIIIEAIEPADPELAEEFLQAPDSDRFVCEICGRRYAARGDCEDHPQEALQDLAREDVRIMLDEFDSRRKHKRLVLLGLCAAILTSPVLFILLSLLSEDNQPLHTFGDRTRFKLIFCVWAGTAATVDFLLWKVFPSRKVLPDLTAEDPEWLTTGV